MQNIGITTTDDDIDTKKQLMARNRERAINELINTEQLYVKRLERMKSLYIEPLRNEKNMILSFEDHQTLFPNVISSIIPLNNQLLSSLQSKRSAIGKEMRVFIPFFKMYQQYLNQYDAINTLMPELRKSNSRFSSYLHTNEDKDKATNEKNKLNKDVTLESYLIEPIQRIPRYEMLIKEILKYTEEDHPDYNDLKECSLAISTVTKQINDRITECEQRHKVFLIEKNIMNLDINTQSYASTNILSTWFNSFNTNKSPISKLRLVLPSRRFIKEGYLKKVSRKGHIRYRFILFNDLLIYCSDTMNRMMILHEKMNLNDAYFELKKVKKENELSNYNAFEIHSIEKSFIAYAATYKETGLWYDAIQKRVDDIRDHGNINIIDIVEPDAPIGSNNQSSKPDVSDGGRRIIPTAPMWSPKQQNTECMMPNCTKQLTGWFAKSYYCNYCGKLVCAGCYQHKLLHYDPDKRKANIKVGVCNECYRTHHVIVRRVSRSESDLKFDLDDLESEEESEEDLAKGFLCFEQLLKMGFDEDIAKRASKQYKDVKHAVQYIQQSGLETDTKINMDDIDELIGSKYQSVDFDVFVAIDFGTHGTGLGYAVKQKKAQQWTGDTEDEYEYVTFLETDWSGTPSGEIKNKTDILLTYDGEFLAFGYDALNRYKSVEDEAMSDCSDDDEKMNLEQRDMLFESFKMHLYNETKGEHKGDIKEKLPCKDGRLFSTEIVFVEALKFIKRTIFKTFKKNGLNITDSESDLQRIQWILTVPAIWSDRAKYKMELWATKAGLIRPNIQNHLRIVYEPDCASISCQYERNEKSQLVAESKPFEKGEKYLLIDAGGGTVDIACHQVVEKDQMQEIYHPTGGPWGSDYVDEHFVSFLGVLFGDDLVQEYIHRYPHDFTKIIDNFRHAKMSFYPNKSDKHHSTRLSASFIIEQGIENDVDNIEQFIANKGAFGLKDSAHLKNETLFMSDEIWSKHLFDRVMDPMIAHIEDLLCTKLGSIQYICICGGLSSSKYFQSRIQQSFGTRSKYKLAIRIPRRPILSVIDGAVKLATRPNYYIVGRKLRMTYGIAADRTLDQLDTSRLPMNYLNTHMTRARSASATTTVSGLFSKFISKNDLVRIGEAIEKEYKRLDRNERKKVIKIYCDSKPDPVVVRGEPLAEFPVYFKRNYNGLKFKVKFYFGDTRIRVFAMNEELHLKYKFYSTSKYIELRPPPTPIIEGIELNEAELAMQIRVQCDGYDEPEYRAWFEVEFVDCDMENDDAKMYETSPIVLTDLRIGVEYKIAIRCVNDKYSTCSAVYKETFVLKHAPPTPTIRRACAKDSMVRLEYECDAIKYRFNQQDEECRPKYEIKHDRDRQSIITSECLTEIESLKNGIDYKFKVRAMNKYGASHWSEWIHLRPLKQPCKPSDLHVVVAASSICIYWLSYDNMEEAHVCGQFEIVSEPPTTRKVVPNKHKVQFKATDDGLQSDCSYKFKVCATNDNFCVDSEWTESVQLDKTKERSTYRQEKEAMMRTMYELHKKGYTQNKSSNDNTIVNKRNENMKRVSHKLSNSPKKSNK